MNDKLSLSGGVEVYISQVQKLLREEGWASEWVAVRLDAGVLRIESDCVALKWEGKLKEFGRSELAACFREEATVFHVHSLSEPEILECLFSIAPVVRTAHEPRMVCPGQGKFWMKQETICELPAGAHCLLHAYTKRCCNRHPKRLLKAFRNVQYETKVASRRYARVLANSGYTEALLLEAGFSRDKIVHLPLFTEVNSEELRVEETSSSKIVYVGRLSRTKGLHVLLDAMMLVHGVLPQATLTLVGEGHDRGIFEAQVRALGLEGVVEFIGWGDRETVQRELRESEVVAFPSIYPEAFGISGLEAMALGKPVVGFDVGGVSDWLKDGETGLLVPLKNTLGFAEGLMRVLSDNEMARSMGKAAKVVVAKEFNARPHGEILAEIYVDSLQEFRKSPIEL